MTISTYVTIAASTVLATACATNNAQKNGEVVKTGLVYAEQVNSMITKTLEAVIDVDSTELYFMRTKYNKNKEKMFYEKNRETSKLTEKILTFRKLNNDTKRYFIELELFISNPTRQDTRESFAKVITAMSKEHDRKTKNKRFSSSYYDEKGYISSLSNMAVNAHYSNGVQQYLRKHAVIMNNHLSLQENQLRNIVSMLKNRMTIAEDLHLLINVKEPYLNDSRLQLHSWKASRREWFELQQAALELDDLKEAQNGIRKAWERVLHGDRYMTSFNHMLNDVSDVASTVHSFENELPQYELQ